MNNTVLHSIGTMSRVFLVIMLFFSSAMHLQNQYRFASHIAMYQLTSPKLTVLLAAFLPVFQLVLAYALMFISVVKASSLLICILFVIYSIAQIAVFLRGDAIKCGCFGEFSNEIGFYSIGLTILSLICGVASFHLHSNQEKSPTWSR